MKQYLKHNLTYIEFNLKLQFIFLVFLIFFQTNFMLSQCNWVTISNQTEMDNFSCSKVTSLEITNNDSSNPITDYSNLSILDTVLESLDVQDFNLGNTNLVFPNLKFASEINISNISTLQELSFTVLDSVVDFDSSCGSIKSIDLSFLRHADRISIHNGSNVEILNLALIEYINTFKLNSLTNANFSIQGLEKLTYIYVFYLSNTNVNNLSFLPNSLPPPNFYISNCFNLTDISYFQNKTQIELLNLKNCPISDFSPLNQVQESRLIELNNLPNLINLDFLKNLVVINGSFRIMDNPSLTNIDSLKNLRSTYSLLIENNSSLSNCCILEFLMRTNTFSSISLKDNGTNCESLFQVFNTCQDIDSDGKYPPNDNCPEDYNPNQDDVDSDNVGDLCDNCPNIYNPDQEDTDQDGIGNVCDGNVNGDDPKVKIDNSDLIILNNQRGIVLKNKLDDCYRITVNKLGKINVIKISCP